MVETGIEEGVGGRKFEVRKNGRREGGEKWKVRGGSGGSLR
jgi:hypothetical protein